MSESDQTPQILKFESVDESNSENLFSGLIREAKRFQSQEDLNRANLSPTYRISNLSTLKSPTKSPLKLEADNIAAPETKVLSIKGFKDTYRKPSND